MIYAGVDSNGTNHNCNAWTVPGGGAGLVREGDGLRVCQLRNGRVTPGIHNPMSYNRPMTRDTFTVPFEVSGELMLHSRATDPVIFGTGLKPHWTWAVSLHPVFVDEANNVVTGFAPASTNWGASGQIDGKYGIARAERYTPSPFSHDAQFDGQRHRWRMVVPDIGTHEVYWDDQLVYRVVEKVPPAKWWTNGRFHAALRLDYYDCTLYNLTPGDSVTRIQPRSVIGTPAPPANRRRLDRVDVLLAHHVGVSTDITSRYQDPAKELSDAKAAATWGNSSGRSWEYNYMIGLGGTIFEQAGEYMAQHCLNFNTRSGGVLFLNADEIQVTPAQIEAWHWLRADMARRGTLAADHECCPHYRYRDTSCPGIRADPPGRDWESPTGQGRVGNLIPSLANKQSTTPPVISPAPSERMVDMYFVIVTNGPESTVRETWLLSDGTQLSHLVDGHAVALMQRVVPAIPQVRPETADETAGLIRSCRTITPCPPEWVNTAWGALWTSSRG